MLTLSLRFYRRLRRSYHNRHIRHIVVVLSLVALCIILHSACFYFFERAELSKLTLWDSVWATLTTITTVGYGDYFAATVGGRIATIVLIYFVGLASFTYVITQIVDIAVEGQNNRRFGLIDCRDLVDDHIIIVNYPSELRVGAIIDQLASDPVTSHRSVVILADSIEEHPFNNPNVHFVRGSPLQDESLNRANVARAYASVVLTPGTDEHAADAIASSIVSLIETLNPKVRTIVECSSIGHLPLFRAFKCDAVIPTGNIAAKILAQEVRDHGLSHAIAELLTQAEGSEIFTEAIKIEGFRFNELQSLLVELRAQVILVGVIRTSQHWINPAPDFEIQPADRLILISNRRSDWKPIHAQLLSAKRGT